MPTLGTSERDNSGKLKERGGGEKKRGALRG